MNKLTEVKMSKQTAIQYLIQEIKNDTRITIRSDFFYLEARCKCSIELLRLFDASMMPYEILQKLDTIWQILGTY